MPRSRIHYTGFEYAYVKDGSILIKDTLRLFVTITGGKLGVFQFGFAIKGYEEYLLQMLKLYHFAVDC